MESKILNIVNKNSGIVNTPSSSGIVLSFRKGNKPSNQHH